MEAWFVLVLAALTALILEFLTGTMILLALAITCITLAVTVWLTGYSLTILGLIGAGLWLATSLALRHFFGSWGSTQAENDPNEYERGGSLGE